MFWKITVADIIQFSWLLATILIAFVVNKNFTKGRYIKEFFINELKYIRDDYKNLFSDIYSSKLNAVNIKDRLKILSNRINMLNTCVKHNLKVNNHDFISSHSEFQMFITGDDEFNTHYKDSQLNFSDTTKTKIMSYQKKIIEKISQYIIDINNA